jgi:aspartyl-tRNA(Asn)/glutamyl-tRNA(Gln) amidotransferase subunit B
MTWESVIGLEVHIQLATQSKMFCGCSTNFGDPPNTNVCPVCLGLPGALPVPNGEAVRLGTAAALAIGCTVHERSVFARKNYFYPDLPKGYQISQFDEPLATGGQVWFDTPDGDRMAVSITRLHLEEDSGKSLHDRIPGKTAIDLNRAGVPLAEIVSGPDLRMPADARAYLTALKQVLLFTGASDCSMEKGSLRVDANLSIRRPGETELNTKTEVKNMNSFANVERALTAERERQIAVVESGGEVEHSTLLFDAGSGAVRPMRSKEESHDYRYFAEPDLPPLVLSRSWIDERVAELPELPEAKRKRLVEAFDLSDYDAKLLTSDVTLVGYYEEVVAEGADPKSAANWIMGEVIGRYNQDGRLVVTAGRLAELISMVQTDVVSLQAAKRVFQELGDTGGNGDPQAVAQSLGLLQVGDTDALGTWVDDVLAEFPDETRRFRNGEAKLMGFFVGQVMKRSKGQADPKKVQPVLRDKLKG